MNDEEPPQRSSARGLFIGEGERMLDKTVKVVLLSGFLGSGKTTLLKRLVDEAEAKGLRSAVLMNEAGDVNLDGLAVDASIPMAEMLGGCICCTIRADVGVELMQLAKTHRPDIVWIESTGIAHPLEIMDAVSDASMYEKIELAAVATVADARHLLDRVRIGGGKTLKLMIEQIRASTLLVLNKTDLIGEAERLELIDWLRGWNADAEIVPAVRCDLGFSFIEKGLGEGGRAHGPNPGKGGGADRDEPEREPGQREQDSEHDLTHEHDHEHKHDRDHAHVHHHIGAATCYLDGPLDSHAFESWLRALPDNIYRAKGIVTFRDTASRFLFQYAYRELDFMRITPQKTVHDVAVFIGEDIPKRELERELRRLVESSGA